MKRRNYTVGERAIMILGLRAGITPNEINDLIVEEQMKQGIKKEDCRRVPASSFAMVKFKYLPNMTDAEIWEHIKHPKPMGDLKND